MKSNLSSIFMAILFLIGCTDYYRVADPSTGKVYYTKDLDKKGSGALEFVDARTGEKVTLPSSEVREITKEEFRTGRNR